MLRASRWMGRFREIAFRRDASETRCYPARGRTITDAQSPGLHGVARTPGRKRPGAYGCDPCRGSRASDPIDYDRRRNRRAPRAKEPRASSAHDDGSGTAAELAESGEMPVESVTDWL